MFVHRGNWGKRVTAGVLALWMLGASAPLYADQATSTQQKQKLLDVFNIIQENHVSGAGESELTDAAIKGMVESLKDPYTTYFTAEEMKQFTDSIEQQYVGIGIRYESKPEGIYVAEVFPDSPAAGAGFTIGDVIVEAGGYSYHTDGFSSIDAAAEQMTKHIIGQEGTSVSLTYIRNGKKQTTEVKRQKIQLPVTESKKFPDGTGYIRLTTFSSEADKDVAARLKELGKITALVLDLRNNGGGLLDAAVGIAKLFIKEGILIHTSDRDKADQPVSIRGGTAADYPIYVIVNENSASASEVLTGALQDYGIAKVVGVQSYGKGSVQQLFDVTGGGMLKVTVEEYFTPKKKPVNHVGITPDIPADGSVPQLLTAFRVAGHTPSTLTMESNQIAIDGVSFREFVPVLPTDSDANERMVPTRIIASMLGVDTAWEQETGSVVLSRQGGGEPVRFSVLDGGLVLMNGTSFLPLSRVQQDFPQLSWERNGEAVTIRVDAAGGTK